MTQENTAEPIDELSHEHASELNGYMPDPEVRRSRLNELRQQYASSPYALEDIDIYDHYSPYGVKRQELVDMFRLDRNADARLIMDWFSKNYPLHHPQAIIESNGTTTKTD